MQLQNISGNKIIDYDAGLWYYLNDKKFFRTRWQAYDHGKNLGLTAIQIQNQIKACINKNLAFDSFDWTVEPKQSWNDMVLEKLKEFRDKYSHLSILFSGGQDSTYLLNMCLKYKIKVDEIITYRSALPGFDNDYNNSEVDGIAIPHLKRLDTTPIGSPLITIPQITDWKLVEQFFDEKYTFEVTNNIVDKTPMNMVNNMIGLRPGNSVMLRGSTEPMIYYDKKLDKFYAEIYDTDNFVDGHQTDVKTPFFTNPEFPEIHAKQCHVVKNWLRERNSFINAIDNFEQYKFIYNHLVRGGLDSMLNIGAKFFTKNTGHNLFRTKKALHFAKQLKKLKPELFEKYMRAARISLKGIPLNKFPRGVSFGKFYLE